MKPLCGFVIILILTSGFANGQAKRALIIGIDNYYEQKGTLSPISLHGCVNDATAVESILTGRMGFRKSEIVELFNEQATRANITKHFKALIDSCRPSDFVFVYYAGHGAYLVNSQSAKNGHNQAILASDVYAPGASIIRDNEMKSYFNAMIDKKAVVTAMFDCCYSGGLARAGIVRDIDTTGDVRSVVIRDPLPDFDGPGDDSTGADADRRMPLTTADLKDSTFVQRPEDKRNSKFLFFAAASPAVESKERFDLNNMKHGVFTAAFIEVMKKSQTGISSNELLKQINSELARQYITPEMQGPMIYGDKARFNMNLLGDPSAAFSQATAVSIAGVQGGKVVLAEGASAGLTKGNLLTGSGSNKNIVLVVDEIQAPEKAIARVNQGSVDRIRKADIFRVTDWRVMSAPRLRIYLPAASLSLVKFNAFMLKVIQHALADEHFLGYFDLVNRSVTYLFYDHGQWTGRRMFAEAKQRGSASFTAMNPSDRVKVNAADYASVIKATNQGAYFIYLPVPEEICLALKKELAGDQNIEFVNDAAQADVALYGAVSKDGKTLHFLCSKEQIGGRFLDGFHMPEENSCELKGLTVPQKSVMDVAGKLRDLALHTASFKGWLNKYPAKRISTPSPKTKQ